MFWQKAADFFEKKKMSPNIGYNTFFFMDTWISRDDAGRAAFVATENDVCHQLLISKGKRL